MLARAAAKPRARAHTRGYIAFGIRNMENGAIGFSFLGVYDEQTGFEAASKSLKRLTPSYSVFRSQISSRGNVRVDAPLRR
jgi:hypothetical protein